MATYNGKQLTALNFTGSATGATVKDIGGDVLSMDPSVTDNTRVVTSTKDAGARREYLREDATLRMVCRKTTDTDGAWDVMHADKGDVVIECAYGTGFEAAEWSGTFIRQSISPPYGADGDQAFTVVYAQSGGAPITWG